MRSSDISEVVQNGFVSAFSVGTEYSDLFSGAVLIDRSDKRQYDKK